MKKLLYLSSLLVIISLVSCSKKCDSPKGKCAQTNNVEDACLAHYQSWFYNEKSNKCELLAYSGCNPKGFETEAECNACLCNKK